MTNAQDRADIARRNGALSKGPKTAEGRTRSSRNAITHGLTADKTTVLQNENPEAWQRVLAEHLERYRPANTLEHELVEDIAFCRWRLRRFRGVDTALWDLQMDDGADEFARRYAGNDETARLAFAFRTDPNIHLASRYEGRLRRACERAIRNWKDYKTQSWNGGLENEKTQNEPS